MANRIDVSSIQNLWHDAQRVDQNDLNVEQTHNTQSVAALENNHFGSGVLLASQTKTILFDSDNLDQFSAAILAAHNFDGTGISPSTQPSDNNLGNQLEIELTDSLVFGRYCVRVAIIGLAFDDTVISDRLYFYRNESQTTANHYKQILTLMFSDFQGNNICSRQNGGRIVIREAASFQLSLDALSVAQDVEPDLFWRDFKLASPVLTLFQTLQAGMGPVFSPDALDINTTGQPNHTLLANDVVSQVGEKFLATSNNIQKITLLLGTALDPSVSEANEYNWNGDLIISLYPLQTSVSCPTDIIPTLAIDFDPAPVPLAQLSVNQASLQDFGYVLTNVLQPVDFVFSSTKIAASGGIIVGQYYAITVKRSGADTTGTILLGCGTDRYSDGRTTLFSGVWVDVLNEDLWFEIWSDSVKISDGQGYDQGLGITYDKTTIDPDTGAAIDNQIRYQNFSNTGQNIINIGLLQAVEVDSETIQDERTGDQIYSRKQEAPGFSFVSQTGLTSLQAVGDPLIIGAAQDTNPKLNPTLVKVQATPGLVKGDNFTILNPDPDLLSLNLLGSKLIPNNNNPRDYRIFRTTLCTDLFGDVNGDGYIDSTDQAILSALIGESIHFTSTQAKIASGAIDALQLLRADVNGDGYITTADSDLLTKYINRQINAFPAGTSFNHMTLEVQESIGRYDAYYSCPQDGYDGYITLGPGNIINISKLDAAQILYDGYYVPIDIALADHSFLAAPFIPITYTIKPQPYWMSSLAFLSSDARLVPAAFTSQQAIIKPLPIPPLCEDYNENVPVVDSGRNDFFVPNNFIIGDGEILRPDNSFYKIDFEVGTIILQLPQIPLTESSINVFEKFISDRGDGMTRAGYKAMRYADGTTVQDDDLLLNKLRFSIAVQSFNPNWDSFNSVDGYGIVVDDQIGVYFDQVNAILKLTIKDLSVDPVFLTLITKIQIQVYLKRGGFNNDVLTVLPTEIIGLIS